jgi:hypothetical protein
MFALILYCIVACYSVTALAQGREPGRDSVLEYAEKFGVKEQVPPHDLVPVVNAMHDNHFVEAIKYCNDVIARDEQGFRSKPEATWIKSEAYRYKADATFRLKGNRQEAMQLLKSAADLGNLLADKAITEGIWRKFEGDPDYASIEATSAELGMYLHIGAELGDAMSAVMLGSRNYPGPITKHEQTYWAIIGFALAINDDIKYRRRMIQSAISRIGESETAAAITEFSDVPARTAAGPGSLPGRGLVATIYADATMRREYGYSYGRRGTEGMRQGPSPDNLEVFKALQGYANVAGDIEAFLLVPVARKYENHAIISAKMDDVLSVIGPSDYVFVSCHSLSHVAMVHHIDRGTNLVYLIDGLWQFWQPSHNSCISQFDLVPFKHGGFLAKVSLADLGVVLKAVVTLRDRVP